MLMFEQSRLYVTWTRQNLWGLNEVHCAYSRSIYSVIQKSRNTWGKRTRYGSSLRRFVTHCTDPQVIPVCWKRFLNDFLGDWSKCALVSSKLSLLRTTRTTFLTNTPGLTETLDKTNCRLIWHYRVWGRISDILRMTVWKSNVQE
jgi:hypothetical protein